MKFGSVFSCCYWLNSCWSSWFDVNSICCSVVVVVVMYLCFLILWPMQNFSLCMLTAHPFRIWSHFVCHRCSQCGLPIETYSFLILSFFFGCCVHSILLFVLFAVLPFLVVPFRLNALRCLPYLLCYHIVKIYAWVRLWCGFHSTLDFRFDFDCKRSVI